MNIFLSDEGLIERLDGHAVPDDYRNPNWSHNNRVHEWKNHVSHQMKEIWHTFSDEQRAVIALNADEQAGREHWN